MPTYTYECPICDHPEDKVYSVHDERPKKIVCAECGGAATRVFQRPQISTFTAYRTDTFDGKMREVRTARQEDALCKKNKCARLLSTDWIDPAKSRKAREKKAENILPSMEESYRQVKHELGLGAETTVADLPGSKRLKTELVSTTP